MKNKKEKLSKDLQWLISSKQYHDSHGYKYITMSVVDTYRKKALQIKNNTHEDTGEMRVLRIELQKEYGLTEIEAINILNGYAVSDIIKKYERIRYRIELKKTKPVTENDDEEDE